MNKGLLGVPRGGGGEDLPGNRKRGREQDGTQRPYDCERSKLLEPEQHHLTSAETFYLLADLLLLKALFLRNSNVSSFLTIPSILLLLAQQWDLSHWAKEQDFYPDDMKVWRRGE